MTANTQGTQREQTRSTKFTSGTAANPGTELGFQTFRFSHPPATPSLCETPLDTLPRAATAKDHKPLSQFWRPEPKIKVWMGPRSLTALGEKPAWPRPASRAPGVPGLGLPDGSLCLRVQGHPLFYVSLLCASYKDTCIEFETHLGNPG